MSTQKLLTKERMEHLLTYREEKENQDYKRDLPPRGIRTCSVLDLLTDLVAMANSGGGVVVFGVEDDGYKPVGLQSDRKLKPLDERDIALAFRKYLDCELAFEFIRFKHEGLEFAFLAVPARKRPLIFQQFANCQNCGEHSGKKHFFTGACFVRDGSSTCKASDEWLNERLYAFESGTVDGDSEPIRVTNNLPSRYSVYDEFVGRREQIDDVVKLLADPRRRVTWLQGSGGIGKTALAYRIADSVVHQVDLVASQVKDEFDYVVWASAKETRLTAQGIEEIAPQFTTLNDIVRAIATTTDLRDVPESDLTGIETAEDALKVLGPPLTSLTGLLVIDNMETVADQNVLRFLELLPGRSRALVTTRHSMDPSQTSTVVLQQMTVEDAKELIRTEAMRTATDWIFQDESVMLRVIQLTDRIPLVIRLVVPLIKSPESLEEYRHAAMANHGNLLEFCYRQTFATLSEAERLLFFAIAQMSGSAQRNDLAFIASVNTNDLAEADAFQHRLEQLWHLSLVTIRRESPVRFRYDMLPLVRDFARKELRKDALAKQTLTQRLDQLKITRSGNIRQLCGEAHKCYQDSHDYRRLLAALNTCIEQDSQSPVPWLIKAEVAEQRGKNSDAAQAVANVKQRTQIGSREFLDATKVEIKIAIKEQQYSAVIDLYYDTRGADGDPDLPLQASYAFYQIGRIESKNKEWDKARANYFESIDLAKRAAKVAKSRGDSSRLAEAFAQWAFAAETVEPEVAYQAMERAIQLGAGDVKRLRRLKLKLAETLTSLPVQDLLREDKW